jgi:hypothetical protein
VQLKTKKSATEILIPSTQASVAAEAASELGIDVKIADVRGAGGGELAKLVWDAANDPFIQGAFLGFLISRGIIIETKSKDGLRITIKNLKTLKRQFKEFLSH